ncbi:unnamed protein product [Blepharisma stoltei]|uniref:Uncharacterized protein n=1 Tax=Blepharisma stoltei TaxID=1481888 RepID=A0AAU9JTU5_9CILI|nr:unnamed protein product [Blepharisma stoltei]
MSFFKRFCYCCYRTEEIEINEESRILPKNKADNSGIQKFESPYTIFTYGITPPNLHLFKLPLDWCRVGILKISCGAEHLLMLSQEYQLFSAGNNIYGQCARDPEKTTTYKEDNRSSQETESSKYIRLKPLVLRNSKVIDIATGSYHSLVLVKDLEDRVPGTIYTVMAFGHETGCGFSDKKHNHVPTEIFSRTKFKENPKNVYAGQMRSAILLESGKVLMVGEWFNGSKQRELKEIPLHLEENDQLKKIAIGKMHAIFLTKNGKTYSIGDNTYGEIGFSRDTYNKQLPALIPFFRDINAIDIAAGARHSLVLEETGKLFAFGDNSEEQCGLDTNRAYEPMEVETKGILGKKSVVTRFIFCGDAHSAVVTSEGDLFAWGDNTAGRLGIKGGLSIYRPRLVDDLIGRNICDVALGGFFSIFLVGPKTGSILSKEENILKTRIFGTLISHNNLNQV